MPDQKTKPTPEKDSKIGKQVYVTKYALTRGIEKMYITHVSDDSYVYVSITPGATFFDSIQCILMKTAFFSEKAAKQRVKSMIDVKLKSLQKQVEKFEKMQQEF